MGAIVDVSLERLIIGVELITVTNPDPGIIDVELAGEIAIGAGAYTESDGALCK